MVGKTRILPEVAGTRQGTADSAEKVLSLEGGGGGGAQGQKQQQRQRMNH